MENAIYIGLSRQSALRREMSLIANNVANSSTTAFKREIAVYTPHRADTKMEHPLDFVIDHGSIVIFDAGTVVPTQNAFDLAIEGNGFFAVDDGTRQLYTRNGSFRLDPNNQLITSDGHLVMDADDNPILIPRDGRGVEIANDGTISVGPEVIGTLKLVEFERVDLMQKRGGTIFETTEAPKPAEGTEVLHCHLETSNVSPISELTRMIDVHRTYDGVKRMLDRENERMRDAVRKLSQGQAA